MVKRSLSAAIREIDAMLKRLALSFALSARPRCCPPPPRSPRAARSPTPSRPTKSSTPAAPSSARSPRASRRWSKRPPASSACPTATSSATKAAGAFVVGGRYGQGTLYTRNEGDYPLFWQGPSIGLDFGGDGSKVMMLVYNLKSTNDIFGRFPGVDGPVYVVGGLGMTVMKRAASSSCRSARAWACAAASTSAISTSPTSPPGIPSDVPRDRASAPQPA